MLFSARHGAGLVVLATALVAIETPSAAEAQDGRDGARADRPQQRDFGRGFGGMGQDQVGEADVELMADVLGFDEPQRLLAEELFVDLREQRAAMMVGLREMMQGVRGEGGRPDREAMERFREESEKVLAQAEEMEKLFYEDIKLVLTPEQRANWSDFEARLARARALRGIAGAVDVARVFEGFASEHGEELDENELAGAKALAQRFSSEIDRQVAERAKLLEQNRPGRGGEGGFDRGAMREMMEARRAADEKMAEISTRYADSIERTLPEGLRGGFRFEINRSSLGGMMRPGSIVERVESALENPGLEAGQKQELRAIEADMHKRFNALVKELAAMRAQAREDRGGDNRGRRGQRGEGMGEIRQKLQEIENELSERLRAVTGGDA